MAVELNIVLSAELSGRKAIRLSWTAEQNANFEIFWKSNIPAGQEYVFLASTNAFEYTTADLEPTKIYQFYIRGWIGEQFFVSNAVELFVSCGKGVVLTGGDTDEPPCQLAVLGNVRFADMTGVENGENVSNVAQDPLDKDSFYFLEAINSGGGSYNDYRLFKFTWPNTTVLLTTITDTGNGLQNLVSSKIPDIAYNPNTGAYHICFFFSTDVEFASDSAFVDVNLTTLVKTKNTNTIRGLGEYLHWDTCEISHFLDGTHLYFCVAGVLRAGPFTEYLGMIKKEAGNTTAYFQQIDNSGGSGITGPLPGTGRFLNWGSDWFDLNFVTMTDSPWAGTQPTAPYYAAGGAPMNKVVIGNDIYRCGTITTPPVKRYFYRWNPTESQIDYIEMVNSVAGFTPYAGGLAIIQRPGKSYMLMAHYYSDYPYNIYVSRLIKTPQLTIYNTRFIRVPDANVSVIMRHIYINYPYIYCYYGSGNNGQSICKICNGVA